MTRKNLKIGVLHQHYQIIQFPHFGQNTHKNGHVWGFLFIEKCATLEKSSYTWPHCKNEMGSKGKITEKIAQPFRNPFDYTDFASLANFCQFCNLATLLSEEGETRESQSRGRKERICGRKDGRTDVE